MNIILENNIPIYTYDLSYSTTIDINDLSHTFLYIKDGSNIIDISFQYNTLIYCISNVSHKLINNINKYVTDKCYTLSGITLNIQLDISTISVEPTFTGINIGSSLLQQFIDN